MSLLQVGIVYSILSPIFSYVVYLATGNEYDGVTFGGFGALIVVVFLAIERKNKNAENLR